MNALDGVRRQFALRGHPVWDEIAPEITPREFSKPWHMDVAFLRLLSKARRRCGWPFHIVSDHREPGIGVANSAHTNEPCRAVDLRCTSNVHRFMILMALATVHLDEETWESIKLGLAGFTRLGVYPPTGWQIETYGKGAGSLHVDGEQDTDGKPTRRVWTGY